MSRKTKSEGTTRNSSTPTRRNFLLGTAAIATGVSSGAMAGSAPSAKADPASAHVLDACLNLNAPMKEVRDKVAFISGGSSGIGLGIAQAFVEAGMKVVIGYMTKAHADSAMKSLANAGARAYAIHVDVTDRAAMEKAAAEAAERFGKVHVLVNNAGVGLVRTLERTTYNDWDWVVGVNLYGVFNGVHAFLPYIQRHGEGGQIISISSIAGLVGVYAIGAYAAAKFGVVGMMECLRHELDNANIGVSVCCPAGVDTAIGNSNRNRAKEFASTGNSMVMDNDKKVPQYPGVVMSPREVGALILRGMRRNDLYILTHPEFDGIIRARQDLIIASMPRDVRPTTTARVDASDPLYITEQSRYNCAWPAESPLGK